MDVAVAATVILEVAEAVAGLEIYESVSGRQLVQTDLAGHVAVVGPDDKRRRPSDRWRTLLSGMAFRHERAVYDSQGGALQRLRAHAVECRRLLSIAVACCRLPSLAVDCCRLPSLAVACCRLLSIAVACRRLPSSLALANYWASLYSALLRSLARSFRIPMCSGSRRPSGVTGKPTTYFPAKQAKIRNRLGIVII